MSFDDLKKHYEGKKVFLTGHTGFKGTWMIMILKQLGAEVRGYALPPLEHNAMYHQVRAELYCDSVIADIRNRDKVHREILNYQPDYIFHMAAQALVLEGYKNPVETFQTNLMGTVHIMDALRDLKQACKAIMITTDKVYENLEREEPYVENEPLGGFDPYSNSKACCELAVSSYRNSYFNNERFSEHNISLSSARSGNVIGGGDFSANRIIPDMIKAFSKDESLLIRNPDSVRPWQHVLDPLRGYLVLGAQMNASPKEYNEAFNFGPQMEDRLTVKELVETGIDFWRGGSYEISRDPNKPHEAKLLRLNIDKAQKALHWKPLYSSADAIRETVIWYKAVHEGESAKDVTLEQIDQFFYRA